MAEIALAASAREWPDRLHRFLLDHGGGRIAGTAMGPDQALTIPADVLLVDDVCSFLTPHLVQALKRSGVEVVGVYQPEDGSDAKRRLLECGISDVIEAAATPEEFLQKLNQTLSHRSENVAVERARPVALRLGVTGPAEGVGMTEVAIGLAHSLSSRIGTVLIDLDPVWPSVAQRLDLPVHPNIRTAIDHALHEPARLVDSRLHKEGLDVIGGRADAGLGDPVGRHEVVALTEALEHSSDVVVADLGPLPDVEAGMAREFDTLVVVSTSDPVGVTRLLRIVDRAESVGNGSLLAVLNMVPRSRFERSEALAEVASSFPHVTVTLLPRDARVTAAAWEGQLVTRGPFIRSVRSMADVVARSVA